MVHNHGDFISVEYTVLIQLSELFDSYRRGNIVSEYKVKVSEDDENIVFKYVYTSDAIVLYSEYLISAFTSNSASVDLAENSIYVNKSEGEITVRKSDGCLIKHTVDFSVLVEGVINLESKTSVTVNATGTDIDILTLTDWSDKYPRNEGDAV